MKVTTRKSPQDEMNVSGLEKKTEPVWKETRRLKEKE
jgi:hypothetical protein